MKKYIAVFMALLTLFLTACGNKPATTDDTPSTDDSQKIEVDEGLLNVDITIPASFFETFSTEAEPYSAQDIVEDDLDPRIKNAVVNDDGSLTFTISKADHRALMQEMRQSIIDSTEEAKANFSSLQSVEVSSDCTKIDMFVDRAAYEGSFDFFAAVSYEIQALMYQAFNGTADKAVIVSIIDAETKEVIESVDSSEQ